MSEDIIQELSRRSIFLTKNEEATLSWNNSVIAARTDRGNHYLQFTHNLECLDKNIDLLEFYTPVPKESPATDLFSHKLFPTAWRNSEFTEMLITPELWPHDPQMAEELTNISVLEWSPKGFVQNCECALAVLNNIGDINFYIFINKRWAPIFSLAPYLRQLLHDSYDSPQNLKELKQAVYTVDACGICWSQTVNLDSSCYFVTAQKNGALVFWCLKCNEANITARVCGLINDNTEEICSLQWIPLHDDKFLLICSDFFGRIIAYECIIDMSEIKAVKSHILWSHKDRMIVKQFYYMVHENKIVLACNKHRHLLVQMFDKDYKQISQYVKNVNDNRITSLIGTNNGIYLSTVNCEIFKIDICITDNNLDVSINTVDFKVPCETYELYSLSFSSNCVLWAIGMVNRKAMHRKEPVLFDIIFASSDKLMNSAISILLENPTKKLTEYWDCIELIRYRAIKTNSMPSIDFESLYAESATDIYKLKVYLILVKLYTTLKRVIKISNGLVLPESSIETLKEKILLNQAISVINEYENNQKSENELTVSFEAECFQGAKSYIEYYCKKYKKSLEEFIDSNRFSNIEFQQEYICQCCDEKLEGFSCKDKHLNMICSLTFTPIEIGEYLVCKSCGVIARMELFSKQPMCVFCDLYLQKSYINV
ncbi:hypothetical protein O3G_MSEX011681 [Manduca sexta]|uniref:Transcription factor IIIC 90kDa subunit N-terminal domain-containing protein n=1 Tax=Manduca sexta TaxID=7130 RepID=A0A921ZLC7_MANSE|nr:hypothetical protein O3G_MSEX011681 [Manduca sexta]